MYYNGGMGFFGMHAFWWMFWVAFVILGFSFFDPVPKVQSKNRKDGPLEILQKRFARGEISATDYEERKLRLRNDQIVSPVSGHV